MSKRTSTENGGAAKSQRVDEDCAICLEVMPDEVPTTNCGHKFHPDCLSAVGIVNFERPCPLCRSDTSRTAEQSAQKRKIDLHLKLLLHSSGCLDECPSENCAKMKRLITHVHACRNSVGCEGMCTRMIALLNLHARRCQMAGCIVRGCAGLRYRMAQERMAQAATAPTAPASNSA